MANEKRMREKLIEILREPIFIHELADPTDAVADYLLDNDVVPVVRCKDCKFFCADEFYEDTECVKWRTKWGVCYTTPDGYCHKGERRNENP